MAKLDILKGSTSQSVDVFIQDSTVTTGAGKTGLAFNTASLVAYYHRIGSSATAITLATQTVNGAWSSGGFVELDATNMPGIYRLDIPDAVLATGVRAAVIMLKGATGMAPCPLEIQLTNTDNQNATTFGLANLDAAITSRLAPTVAARTLDVSTTGEAGLDFDNIKDATGSHTLTNITVPIVTTTGTATNLTNAPTNGDLTATMKTSVTTAATAATPIAASVSGNVAGNVTGSVGSVLGAVGSVTGAVGSVTGNVGGSVGSVAAGGITAASFAANALDAVWSTAVRLLTAGTNIVLAKGVGLTGLNDLSAAQVNTEMVDVLTVDTYAEPAGAPAATSSLKDKIGWGFKLARNLRKTTSAVDSVYNDAGAVVDSTAALSDDGVTFTRGEYT